MGHLVTQERYAANGLAVIGMYHHKEETPPEGEDATALAADIERLLAP